MRLPRETVKPATRPPLRPCARKPIATWADCKSHLRSHADWRRTRLGGRRDRGASRPGRKTAQGGGSRSGPTSRLQRSVHRGASSKEAAPSRASGGTAAMAARTGPANRRRLVAPTPLTSANPASVRGRQRAMSIDARSGNATGAGTPRARVSRKPGARGSRAALPSHGPATCPAARRHAMHERGLARALSPYLRDTGRSPRPAAAHAPCPR